MRDNLTRALGRYQRTFVAFNAGQKAVAVIGTGALLLAAFMVFRWVSTPSYAPLYDNLSAADASAVVDELNSEGVPYQLADAGATILVPKELVYSTRIAVSGKGLPTASESGYSILDSHGLSTSQFQEQTDFKRAMEGELSATIEAVDGVQTAVVHLAIPPKQVFADQQDPTTASVLVDTATGVTLAPDQVQAIVHLVASSIDGLDAKNVTVVDASGRVLSTDSDSVAGAASTQTQAINAFQEDLRSRIQTTLDRVLGPGSSAVQVTAVLDFDKSVTDSVTYVDQKSPPSLSESSSSEDYRGPGAGSSIGGVVGPDGQMDSTTNSTSGSSQYVKKQQVKDNAIDTVQEHRETAPGSVESLHVGVILDSSAPTKVDAAQVEQLISAAVGINPQRGDTVEVTTMPFDQTAEEAAAAELAAATKADAAASRMGLYRNVGLGGLVGLIVLAAMFRERRKNKARERATSYLVEQMREESAARAVVPIEPAPAALALEAAEATEDRQQEALREELAALVERQPEDVAALLRGWLVDR